MPFGFFKKRKKEQEAEKLHYDPTNLHVRDLRKGFVIDYDFKSWEVTAEYEYDWGNEYFSYEYKLVSADDSLFVYVEEDDELTIIVSRKIPFGRLDDEVEEAIKKKGKPPKKITYEGITFYRNSESVGFFKEIGTSGMSEEFINWEYTDETGKFILNIEQWDDDVFAAALGEQVSENAFSNILPS
jgi:hypothetical protein